MPFEMVRNDIAKMNVDAIVNAANRTLLGGGGVDGAIHRAAGPELLDECRTLGGCRTGEAKITKGYRLPARFVIHTVGPVWHGGTNGEKELLAACYRHSLELAEASGCESVAFPMISTGAYGYPKDKALSVAVDEITRFLMDHEMMVYLVVFGHEELLTGKKLFRDIQEYIDDFYAESHFRPNEERGRRRRWQEDELDALALDMQISSRIYGNAIRAKKARPQSSAPKASASIPELERMLEETDESFSEALLHIIDERGWTDAQCYKKANVDRKLFSKIRSNPAYRPSKPTALAFAVALELSLPETETLLRKAGFSLSNSSKFDIIVAYCIRTRNYNVFDINEVLFHFDQPLLGSGMN